MSGVARAGGDRLAQTLVSAMSALCHKRTHAVKQIVSI
jgi:hypothetical protein